MAPDGIPPTPRTTADTISATYAAWAASATDMPTEALARARGAIVDIVGCMVAGASDPAALIARTASRDWGSGPCTVVGAAAGRPPPLAAFLNGIAAHALDFDDNLDPAKAHITAVLAPALLALAEARGVCGRDVLIAYVVGLEIAARVGQGVNPFHRNRGWHATSTVGTIGAAAAAARLIGLDAGRLRHALNMSTSYAGGFMSQFGSMTKPLHAGKAAESGVICALLAEAGMTAGAETFDGPTGLAQLMVGPDLEDLRARGFKAEHGQTLCFETATLGQPFAILAHGLKVKRYPTCASTHRALDAALDLRARHVLSAETVARIDVFAPVTHFNNLMYTDPKSAAEAKFSMEYCLAVALKQGAIGLADFTASALADRALRREMAKVARHPVDQPESRFPTRVDIVLTSGKILSATVDAPKGRADNPLTDDELWEKLRQCCRDAVDPEHAKRIERALRAFDDAPVTALMSELRSEAAR